MLGLIKPNQVYDVAVVHLKLQFLSDFDQYFQKTTMKLVGSIKSILPTHISSIPQINNTLINDYIKEYKRRGHYNYNYHNRVAYDVALDRYSGHGKELYEETYDFFMKELFGEQSYQHKLIIKSNDILK